MSSDELLLTALVLRVYEGSCMLAVAFFFFFFFGNGGVKVRGSSRPDATLTRWVEDHK